MKRKLMFAGIAILLMYSSVKSQTGNHTIILQPGPSAGIDAETRSDLPNESRGNLYDFIANAWTAQGNYFVMRSFLKFDLSAIPTDATILHATLKLTTNLNTGHYQLDSGANTSYLLRVTEPWDEQAITWNNQPDVDFSNPVVLPQSYSNTQTYFLNVSSHIMAMHASPTNNFGWCLRLQTEEKYRCLVFASSDHPVSEWRPELEVQYTICPEPLADFTYQINDNTVQFTNLSSPALSRYWNFGDGTGSVEENPVHTYNHFGSYRVTLEITDSCGTGIHIDTITIACNPPVAGYTWSTGDSTISFISTAPSPPVYAWHWDFGDGTTSTQQNPEHHFASYGTYQVCHSVTDSCGTDLFCDVVYLLEPFALNTSINQSQSDNLTVVFADESDWTDHWNWDFGDGTSSSTKTCSHSYKNYGTYLVYLTAGNSALEKTLCDTLSLKKINVSPNGNGFELYPNPTSTGQTIWFLSFQDEPVITIEIADNTGNIVFEKSLRDIKARQPVSLPVSWFVSGLYHCKFQLSTGTHSTKLMITR